MGKKRKSGRQIDVAQLNKSEKTFLYSKFTQAKSPNVVRSEFVKKFPGSCIPSERLIHKMFILFQKRKYRNDDNSVTLNNNTLKLVRGNPSGSSSCGTSIGSSSLLSCAKRRRKRRKNKRAKEGNTIGSQHTVESTTVEDTQAQIPCITLEDTVVPEKNDNTLRNDSTSNKSGSFFTNSTFVQKPLNIKNDSAYSPNQTHRKGSKKRKRKSNLQNTTKMIKSDGLENINVSNIQPANNTVLNNDIQYPDSSTPYKILKLDVHNRLTVSPIKNPVIEDKKLETILEISDDESDDKFKTVDETGSTEQGKKTEIDIVTIDELSSESLPTTSQEIASSVSKTLQRNAMDWSSIDLTEESQESFSEVLKRIMKKDKVDVFYDLTADDGDRTVVNSLDHKKQHLIKEIAKTANTYKPTVKKGFRNFGSNIYNPNDVERKGLRMIVIDGSNVAMSHGMKKFFSVEGLKICIDYFLIRGHEVKAFVPRFRCKGGKSSNPKLLMELEDAGHVVFTPSREVQGRNIISYDDRYIVQCAAEYGGIIVSGDNYRDLLVENPSWRNTIEERTLHFTWVGNLIMFPQDPLGRNGPNLKTFLSHPT